MGHHEPSSKPRHSNTGKKKEKKELQKREKQKRGLKTLKTMQESFGRGWSSGPTTTFSTDTKA